MRHGGVAGKYVGAAIAGEDFPIQRLSAPVIQQIGGESKDIGALRGEFTGALLDSFCRGSDCDFRPLLCEQTSGCEAYSLRAACARDERDFSGKVHRFDFTLFYIRLMVSRLRRIQSHAITAFNAPRKTFVW